MSVLAKKGKGLYNMVESGFHKQGGALLKITGIYDSVKEAEWKLANFITNNASEVLGLTIEELAERADVSYATIQRFCKKLGYVGYKELKADLKSDVENGYTVSDLLTVNQITPGMSLEDISDNLYNMVLKTLQNSYSMLDGETIDAVTEKLISADSIFCFGSGNSGIIAYYVYSKLMRCGLHCTTEKDPTLGMMNISRLKAGDVLFLVSASGRTKRIIEAAELARKNGVTVVSLGDYAVSPLTKVSDYNLFTTHRNSVGFMNIDIQMMVAQITLVDLLALNCCSKIGAEASVIYGETTALSNSEKLQ